MLFKEEVIEYLSVFFREEVNKGISVGGYAVPKSSAEEEDVVICFFEGLRKLFSSEGNWTYLKPLYLAVNFCAQCHTCSGACPIYLATEGKIFYLPSFRTLVLKRLLKKKLRIGWEQIVALYELSYRCSLCRRCTVTCPMGLDNAVVARELRKLFSQELGWAPSPLHHDGTVLHLEKGSPTQMVPEVARDNVEFIVEEYSAVFGTCLKLRWNEQGSDFLLVPPIGEIFSSPENFAATLLILKKLGLRFTISSEKAGYDGVNYGVFYDDVQLGRIAVTHARIAKRLKAKFILIGECGHQHKYMLSLNKGLLWPELNVKAISIIDVLLSFINSHRQELDATRNDFLVTLHDPCNISRNLGKFNALRQILKAVCINCVEMVPNKHINFCCGGGGGLTLIRNKEFTKWKLSVASKIKADQIRKVFCNGFDAMDKYLCAPCLNCRIHLRDVLKHYNLRSENRVVVGGLTALVANAIKNLPRSLLIFDEMV